MSGVLPKEEAIQQIKHAIEKTYSKKGKAIVDQNFKAVDATLAHLYEVSVPTRSSSIAEMLPVVSELAPAFVKDVTAMMMSGHGDELPVSKMSVDGTYPSGTTKWEKKKYR